MLLYDKNWFFCRLLIIDIAVALAPMASQLDLPIKLECWICSALLNPSNQRIATYNRCKNCSFISHPKCTSKNNCCFLMNIVQMSVDVKQRQGKRQNKSTSLPTYDKSNLDMRFVFPPSPSEPRFSLTGTHTTVTTTSPIAPPTTVFSSVGCRTATTVTAAIVQPVSSASSCNAALIASAVNDAVSSIKEGDPSFVLAQALRILALSISNSVGDISQKIDVLSESSTNFQEITRTYFDKTSQLEASVKSLQDSDKVQNRSIADATSIARAATKGYECDQIKIVGLPYGDSESVKKAVIALGPKIGLKIPPEAISSVRFSSQSAVVHSAHSSKLTDSNVGHFCRSKDAFVSFVHAEQRDSFVRRLGTIKGVWLRDIDPLCTTNRPIHIHEVLTHDRFKLFSQLRKEAGHLRIQSVWHSSGSFYARKSSRNPPRRIWDVGDLQKVAN